MNLQQNGGLQPTDINHHNIGGELHHPDLNCVHETADNQGSSVQDSEQTSDTGNRKRSMNPNRHGKIGVWMVFLE